MRDFLKPRLRGRMVSHASGQTVILAGDFELTGVITGNIRDCITHVIFINYNVGRPNEGR